MGLCWRMWHQLSRDEWVEHHMLTKKLWMTPGEDLQKRPPSRSSAPSECLGRMQLGINVWLENRIATFLDNSLPSSLQMNGYKRHWWCSTLLVSYLWWLIRNWSSLVPSTSQFLCTSCATSEQNSTPPCNIHWQHFPPPWTTSYFFWQNDQVV